MEGRINIVFFGRNSSILGGGLTMLFRLLDGLDKTKFNPTLVVSEKSEVYHKAKELDIEVEVVPFKGVLGKYNRKILAESTSLEKFAIPGRILQYNLETRHLFSKADIVWCHGLRMVLTLLPNTYSTSASVIWNIGLGYHSEGITKYLNSAALRSVDHVFIESEQQAKRIFTNGQYNRYNHKFSIFHKGIDVTKFDPSRFKETSSEDEYVIGSAASIMPRKGLEYLIDAVPLILKKNDDVRFKIAGAPPEGEEEYLKELKDRVRKIGVEEHVEFVGWIDNMPKYYHSLDVFVLPSLNEGIPGVVREALAMEIPVIATDVAGTSEAVMHGETGLLVEPKNPKQIGQAISELVDNRQKANALGRKGRNHIIEYFSISKYISDYENFLETVNET